MTQDFVSKTLHPASERTPRLETPKRVTPEFLKQLQGYGLTTAEITYHLPDHPSFLQTYLWQDYDVAPKFPVLLKFLTFWQHSLDGALHSVRVGHSHLIKAADLRLVGSEFLLN